MKNILFLLSHQPNPRFIKQINYLSSNHNVSVVYFYRDYMQDLSNEYQVNCDLNINIGKLTNGNFIKRVFKLLQAAPRLLKAIKGKEYDIVFSQNIDTLAFFKIVSFFRKNKPKIVIEISDLLNHHSLNNHQHKILRVIERVIFRSIDKLIVTSDKFYSYHYSKIFNKPYFLLENKPLSSTLPKRLKKVENDKITIGIVGLLLQGKPYKTLFDFVKNNDCFEVQIYGRGGYQPLVEEYADKYDNINYLGAYNLFKDSARIYSSIDILYMPYDTKDYNVRLALPNKLYEAMYFKVPIITSKETYLGELVKKYNIGVCVKCCDKDSLSNVLINRDFNDFVENFDDIEEDRYIADNDYKKLEQYILE